MPSEPSAPPTGADLSEPVVKATDDGMKVEVTASMVLKANMEYHGGRRFDTAEAFISMHVERPSERGALQKAADGVRALLRANAPKFLADAIASHHEVGGDDAPPDRNR